MGFTKNYFEVIALIDCKYRAPEERERFMRTKLDSLGGVSPEEYLKEGKTEALLSLLEEK